MYNVKTKYNSEFLRGMVRNDLKVLLQAARQKQYEIKLAKHLSARVYQPHIRKKIRRDIARMLTLVNQI